MAKRDRKNYWVDGQIQGALAMRIVIHWLIFAVIASVLTFTMQFLGDPLLPVSEHLRNVWQNQGIFGLVILMLMPLFLYDSVRLSHRFAGPIVRMRREINNLAAGNQPTHLKFRDGDFWTGLADDFNKLIDNGFIQVDGTHVKTAEDRTESESEPVTSA